ncbi:MAG: HAD family hydrolase [Clostridia bacterium]|nr:HAD family hydrolase [Clostridia bacterium]
MKITTVLFDLDGTLLPMDMDVFIKTYFGELAKYLAPRGYEPQRLIATVWSGTKSMLLNDGTCTNEQRFWDSFAAEFGEDSRCEAENLEKFYKNEFNLVKDICGYNAGAAETVKLAKSLGLDVVLATSPIFPAVATNARVRWTGLEPSDFSYISTYENSHYCKPNPKYYTELLDKLGLVPEECIMVGNDTSDDMPAAALGMKLFFLTDTLINKGNIDLSPYPHGSFGELQKFIRESV